MAQPSNKEVHADRPLTNLSVAYAQEMQNLVSAVAFPQVPVDHKSDEYYVYDRDYWMRSQAAERAPGTESAGSGWKMSTATYTCKVYAVHSDIDDQIAANADPGIDLERDATRWATDQITMTRELEWATKFFTTSTWTGSTTASDITPGTTWDDAASTPIEDIDAQATSVLEKTGRRPNLLVLGPEVYLKLKSHPDILDRIKFTERGIVTLDLLASLFDVKRVMVPQITRNTAAEGATAVYDFGFGKSALLAYSAPNPGLLTPSAGYTFVWRRYPGASRDGILIDRFYERKTKSTRIEGEINFDHKVIGADLATFFSACVA